MPITVLLADDSDVLRNAIRALLKDRPEIELVGEASSVAEAVQMANDLRPEVILMDLNLAKTSRDLKYLLPLHVSRLLAMSVANVTDAYDTAKSLGASAFLDKMYVADELIPTIIRLAALPIQSVIESSDPFQYDIFSGSPESGSLWIERVQGRDAAVERMCVIATEKPGMYFVFGGRDRQVVARADTRRPTD